jgi:hypothetical protein
MLFSNIYNHWYKNDRNKVYDHSSRCKPTGQLVAVATGKSENMIILLTDSWFLHKITLFNSFALYGNRLEIKRTKKVRIDIFVKIKIKERE